jgi:putative phosphoribosyl transferase
MMNEAKVFADRADAGRRLVARLQRYRNSDAVVVGVARGGVIVGAAVAQMLNLSLRALVVRKIGVPGNSELALGAVSETGAIWLDAELMQKLGVSPRYARQKATEKLREAREIQTKYQGDQNAPEVQGRAAILVDDGVATGATAFVAIEAVRALGVSSIVVAAPVASCLTVTQLRQHADEVVVLETPGHFFSIGQFYRDFRQVSDDDVIQLLQLADPEEQAGVV